jgi:hypothetical protein
MINAQQEVEKIRRELASVEQDNPSPPIPRRTSLRGRYGLTGTSLS